MNASYLIRFDDLTATMNWTVWTYIEEILITEGLKPLLAIVPDNRDPNLCLDAPNPRFWERVRGWQARGWTIGLHGYQHLYVSKDAGIVGLNARSEFAGLAHDEQEKKLQRAIDLFRDEGVEPQVWVAPAHSFDERTVAILNSVSINVISDGFFISPHVDSQGMIWIPQQLWRFRALPFGVWTVCFHHNNWSRKDLEVFRRSVKVFAPLIRSVEGICLSHGCQRPAWYDAFGASAYLRLLRWRRGLRRA